MIKTVLAPGVGWPTLHALPPAPKQRGGAARALTVAQAAEARALREAGASYRELALKYKTSRRTMSEAIHRVRSYAGY